MIRTLLFASAFAISSSAFAQDHPRHDDHGAHQNDAYEQNGQLHDKSNGAERTSIALSRTPEIDAALSNGGEPVVVEVLGVVCDFCAKAMNKTFSKREEVSAVYVDLDRKTLNLVLAAGAQMTDDEIDRLVVRAGYKTKAVYRGEQLLRGSNAIDPA